MVKWPVYIKRLDNHDQVGPLEGFEVEPQDLYTICNFLWDFIRQKESRPALVIEAGLPPMLLSAILLRLGRYYKLVVLDGVVVYSTILEHPLGSRV